MTIDKSLKQHYETIEAPKKKKIKGEWHKLAYITSDEAKALKSMGGIETRTPPGLFAYPGHHGSSSSSGRSASSSSGRSAPSASSAPSGGHHGGGGKSWSPTPATVTTAVAPPSILSQPKPGPLGDTGGSLDHLISTKPTPVSISVPSFISEGPTSIIPKPTIDVGFQEALRKADREYFENLEKEKMDFIGGQWVGGDKIAPKTTGEQLKEFENIPENLWTKEQKLLMEKFESEQDWDKVKELADKGHSSDDIQKAMDKGLLLKQDEIRRQGLIERGLAAIKPTTKLESNLLGNIKKTAGGMLKSAAKSAVMKKLGLGSFNLPFAIGSWLFGKLAPGKKEALTSKFSRKPKDMSAFSDLGLYADRQPTDTIREARVGQGTIGSDIALGKKGILESGQELLGLKGIEGHRADVSQMDIDRSKAFKGFKQYDLGTLKDLGIVNPTLTEEELKGIKEGTITEPTGKFAAYGGRIDKPLTGRSRDI